MEEAIEEAVNTTVATFVDKAVTRAMENTFNEAVEREVQEREYTPSKTTLPLLSTRLLKKNSRSLMKICRRRTSEAHTLRYFEPRLIW
jgi:hypothetical protein